MVRFGSYEVLEHVAVGSTGTVYQARHTEIGRIVAVKELQPQLLGVPGLLERFRSEARMLADLDNPHVVAVYDFVEEPGRVWIAEEWVTGATLQAILTVHGRLSPEQALGALRGALLGLAYAHDRGVVHRDVAPSNVVADMAGTSKLLDFGLAGPVGGTGACGTPAFVSPEVARGDTVGKPGDVYSAAAVLFLLLSGAPPFPAADPAAVLRRHLQDPPPTLAGHGPDLAALITRCLDKDPSVRPPDAAALLAALEDAATKRYGVDWLTRAGLAGVVGATVAAGLGTGATVGATETGPTSAAQGGTEAVIDTGTAATVALPSAAPPVTPAAAATPKRHRLRRHLRKTPILATAATVVLLVGTVSVVTLASSNTHHSQNVPRPSSSGGSPSVSPSVSAPLTVVACSLLSDAQVIAFADNVDGDFKTQPPLEVRPVPVRAIVTDPARQHFCTWRFKQVIGTQPAGSGVVQVSVQRLSAGRLPSACSLDPGARAISGIGDRAVAGTSQGDFAACALVGDVEVQILLSAGAQNPAAAPPGVTDITLRQLATSLGHG